MRTKLRRGTQDAIHFQCLRCFKDINELNNEECTFHPLGDDVRAPFQDPRVFNERYSEFYTQRGFEAPCCRAFCDDFFDQSGGCRTVSRHLSPVTQPISSQSRLYGTEQEEFHTTDSQEEDSGSRGSEESDEDEYEDEDADALRQFVGGSMDGLVRSIRERIPNFLNSPSARDLGVVDRVQYIINHTAQVHEENARLKTENERLQNQMASNVSNRRSRRLDDGLSNAQKFEIWYRKEVRFENNLYYDKFVAAGCNDLRVVTSPSFTKSFVERVLNIRDPFHQTKLFACTKAYPNWTEFDDWLAIEVGLESCSHLFARVGLNDMTVVRSGMIDDKLLSSIGVRSAGHRKLILHEISRLRGRLSGSTTQDGSPIPSVDSLLKHLWSRMSSEIREILSAPHTHRKMRGKRPSRQNSLESRESRPKVADVGRLSPPNVATLPPDDCPVPKISTPVMLPPAALNHGRGVAPSKRPNGEMNGPDRGRIIRRQSSGGSAVIAPFVSRPNTAVPSVKDAYRSSRGIARSFSAPNLAGTQSIPSRSNLQWHHKQILNQRPPQQYSGSNGFMPPPASASAHTAPLFAPTANPAILRRNVINTAPMNYSYGNVLPQRARVASASYAEVRSLSAGNLEAIREQHEMAIRQRMERNERLIETSGTIGRADKTVVVDVNIVAPESVGSGNKISSSGRSTDVNMGSHER